MTQHYAAIHTWQYKEQPQGAQMGFVVNQFKKKIIPKPHSIQAIIAAASHGQCIVPANYAVNLNYNYEMNFISSSLIFIDVDDVFQITNPHQMLEQLPHCTGFFYTFSHGKKGNRYRLIFQLSEAISNLELYKTMVEIVGQEVDQLIQYPDWYYKPFKDERTGKMIEREPIVDTKPKSPLLPVRTGIMAPVIRDINARLNAAHYVTLAKGIQLEQAEARKRVYDSEMRYKLSFEDLKAMAEKIGYIPSGTGQKDLWSRLIMGLKHYANTGAITQEQGHELFEIISGSEPAANAWDKLNPSGAATIGSFVDEAKKRGFKFNPHKFGLSQTPVEAYNTELVKVKKYIPTELAKEWLSRDERLLIDSPTGSGKSTALIDASKEISKQKKYSFYIFSAPTRPLAKQLANKHNLMLIRGSERNLWSKVFEAQKNGVRVFVATYDLTNSLIDWIKQMQPHAAFHLIIDEFHKTVTDYSRTFRLETISQLQLAMDKSKSVIALSGTPDDILKSQFNKIIKVNNGEPASPCQEFGVYTYEQQKEALPMLIKLIEAWTKKRRLLIYLNNTEVNAKLYDILRKRGIVTRTVSAAEKSNRTYKQMIEHEMVDSDVQVILATSVIADGISIQNALEWECIVVANTFSQLFNVSLLKQMSNRFRNKYRRFSVFMQAPKIEEDDSFYIESAYSYLLNTAKRFAKTINEEFSGPSMALFRASVLEKRYGLIETENGIGTDPHFLRHEASKAKERYYASRRLSFIKALERILHMKKIGILSVDEALAGPKDQESIEQISEVLSDLYNKEKASRSERFENFEKIFTRDVYESFVADRSAHLQEIKPLMNPEQFNCINVLHKYADFNVCQKVASQVTRSADSYSFVKRLEALTDVLHFESIARNIATKKVYLALKEINDFYTKSDLEIIYESIAKANRIKVSDVEAVAKKLFISTETRSNKKRFYKLDPVTFENVAAAFSLEVEDVKATFRTHLQYQKPAIRAALSRFAMPTTLTQMKLQLV